MLAWSLFNFIWYDKILFLFCFILFFIGNVEANEEGGAHLNSQPHRGRELGIQFVLLDCSRELAFVCIQQNLWGSNWKFGYLWLMARVKIALGPHLITVLCFFFLLLTGKKIVNKSKSVLSRLEKPGLTRTGPMADPVNQLDSQLENHSLVTDIEIKKNWSL